MHVDTTVNSAKQSPTGMNQKQLKEPLYYMPYSWEYSSLTSMLHITTISTIANCPREMVNHINKLSISENLWSKIGGTDEDAVQWEQEIRFQWC